MSRKKFMVMATISYSIGMIGIGMAIGYMIMFW